MKLHLLNLILIEFKTFTLKNMSLLDYESLHKNISGEFFFSLFNCCNYYQSLQ